MKQSYQEHKLQQFAEKKLHAERYKNDYHTFRSFTCDRCGKVPLRMTIEHHTGSKTGDFKGVITGVCSQCQTEKQLFSFTGNHRKPERTEHAECTCGHNLMYAGMCERIEGDEGIIGFFDEGVVVGQCAKCGKQHALVFTD
jgi:hypothetical protein